MYPHITDHAKTRFQQRGINGKVVDYLMDYGEASHAPGGAMKIKLSKKSAAKVIGALKKEIHKIERAVGLVVVQKDGSILTGYHKN